MQLLMQRSLLFTLHMFVASFVRTPVKSLFLQCIQARNQLEAPGGAKSFLRGAQIF